MNGPRRTLVVVTHPRADSLTRAALDRVLAGLDRAGDEVRVIDLDAEDFDPRLTLAERRGHITDGAEDRPDLRAHTDALVWAERLVLVHPTWFGGQPARLKGWFDRVWMNQVAWVLPTNGNRLRGRLQNIRAIHVVTTHGSPRWVNALQGNPGRLRVNRTLRVLCHWRCRTRLTAIYSLDNQTPATIAAWLDGIEAEFAGLKPRRGRPFRPASP